MCASIVKIDDGRWSALVGERITSNAGARVGINQSLVEVSFFVGGEGGDDLAIRADLIPSEHETEEAVQSDEVGAESVVSVFIVDNFWKIEGVNANIGVETEPDITAADSVTEALVFVFWIDDDNFAAHHHGTESFELHRKRFTSTGFSENNKIGIF